MFCREPWVEDFLIEVANRRSPISARGHVYEGGRFNISPQECNSSIDAKAKNFPGILKRVIFNTYKPNTIRSCHLIIAYIRCLRLWLARIGRTDYHLTAKIGPIRTNLEPHTMSWQEDRKISIDLSQNPKNQRIERCEYSQRVDQSFNKAVHPRQSPSRARQQD